MKKFIFAAVLALTPAVANATPSELCPIISSLAGSVMKARQVGVSKEAAISAMEPGATYNLSVALINLAYVYPRYSTPSMQESVIESFQARTEYLCYQNSTN